MDTQNITISHEEVEIALENRLEKNYLLVATIGVSIQFFWTILDLIVIPDLWIQLLFFRLGILLLPILLGLTYKKTWLKGSSLHFFSFCINFTYFDVYYFFNSER
jgi:hypothetical protein